jgi:hypothetical protein
MCMTHIIDAILRRRSPLRDVLVTTTIIGGGVLMLGACIYHFFLRPEWTSPEALAELWPFHASGALALLTGWLIDRQA